MVVPCTTYNGPGRHSRDRSRRLTPAPEPGSPLFRDHGDSMPGPRQVKVEDLGLAISGDKVGRSEIQEMHVVAMQIADCRAEVVTEVRNFLDAKLPPAAVTEVAQCLTDELGVGSREEA